MALFEAGPFLSNAFSPQHEITMTRVAQRLSQTAVMAGGLLARSTPLPHSRKGTKSVGISHRPSGTPEEMQAHSGACFTEKWKVCPCPFQVTPDPQSIKKGFAVLRWTRALLEERQLRGNFIQEDRQVSHKIQFAKDQRLILRHPAHHTPSLLQEQTADQYTPPAPRTLLTG